MNDRAPARAARTANVRAEEAVIGKIIGSAESYWAIHGQLTVDHFTLQHHRDIFAAVAKSCEDGAGPSMSRLEASLPPEWEGVGSVEANLQILLEKAADVSSVTDFVEDILVAWRERERLAIGKIANIPGKTFEQTREAIEARFKVIDDSDRVKHAVTIGEAATESWTKSAEAYQHHGKRMVGMETGIAELDKMMGPLTGGTVVTLAGESGHGKSALIAQILRNNAQPSLDLSRVNPSLFLSMEMSRRQNGYRNLSSMTGIPIRKQIKGDFTEKEFAELTAAKTRLEAMPIYIQDRGHMTPQEYGAECRMANRRYGIKLFALDHMRLIVSPKEHWNEVRTIEYAAAFNKDLAKELDAVFFQLAQLTKGEKKAGNWRFRDSDLFGGGGLKQNSDFIIGVALPISWLRQNQPEPPGEGNERGRAEFDKWLIDMEKWKEKGEVSALKVRDGAGSEWKELEFNGARMLFGDVEREAVPF